MSDTDTATMPHSATNSPDNPHNHDTAPAPVPSEAAQTGTMCSLPEVHPREFDHDIHPERASFILKNDRKWVNGTVIHYYFFDEDSDGQVVTRSNGSRVFLPWATHEAEKDIVRKAFETWKDVGIGLEFEEVFDRSEAEVRIGFERGNGFWSHIGRDTIDVMGDKDKRTMNFGIDLSTYYNGEDTALHEIGHALGLTHEHQNPKAGIVWDEEAVYENMAGSPNFWPREKTRYNIIRKVEPDSVQGSEWDANSIMHYPFSAGLIREPAQYYRTGLRPAPGLSQRDKDWARMFYPPISEEDITMLTPWQSVMLQLEAGEQKNLLIKPEHTSSYVIQTFGTADTVMVLFEKIDGQWRYLDGEDDSGTQANAELQARLFKGKEYMLRIRLFYSEQSSDTAVMMWTHVGERRNDKETQRLAAAVANEVSKASQAVTAPAPTPAAQTATANDPFIYRLVVSALGLAVLLVIIGGLLVARETITTSTGEIVQKDLPDSLIAIGSAAAGALAGLLAFKR